MCIGNTKVSIWLRYRLQSNWISEESLHNQVTFECYRFTCRKLLWLSIPSLTSLNVEIEEVYRISICCVHSIIDNLHETEVKILNQQWRRDLHGSILGLCTQIVFPTLFPLWLLIKCSHNILIRIRGTTNILTHIWLDKR